MNSPKRLAAYIDIQGFSSIWSRDDCALRALGELMRAIFRIGTQCFPNSPDRLFAHQFGDGFLLVTEFREQSLERLISVVVGILRHVSVTGCYAKASIVEGCALDISGCYPQEVIESIQSNSLVNLGEGLMTITPVMGESLIRGVGLDKNSPAGPFLFVDRTIRSLIPQEYSRQVKEVEGMASINWMAVESNCLLEIQRKTQLSAPSIKEMETGLQHYCSVNLDIAAKWRGNVRNLLNVDLSAI